jgi:hypothetical protein
MTLDYLKGDYIQPPSSQSNVAIYSARSIFNNFLVIGSKTTIHAYYYQPRDNVFVALPKVIKSFYYQNEWVQLEVHQDKLYIFYKENYRGYRYSGRTYLEIYDVQSKVETRPDASF